MRKFTDTQLSLDDKTVIFNQKHIVNHMLHNVSLSNDTI